MPERFVHNPEEADLGQLEMLADGLLRDAPVDFGNSFSRYYELRTTNARGRFPPETPQFQLSEFTTTQINLLNPAKSKVIGRELRLVKLSLEPTDDRPGYENRITFTCNMLTGEVMVRGGEMAAWSERCLARQLENMQVACASE